jgi:hypothetical protein
VQVIGHGAKAVNSMAKAFHPLLQQQIKVITVIVTEKDRLSTVATQRDVIETTGNMNAGFARHEQSIGSI